MKATKPFVTGTAAYGPFTDESDINIVMMYYDADRFKAILKAGGIETKEPSRLINHSYQGFTFEWAGRQFQIICVRIPDEHNAWLYATEEMQREAGDLEGESREQRIKTFEKYRDEFIDRS